MIKACRACPERPFFGPRWDSLRRGRWASRRRSFPPEVRRGLQHPPGCRHREPGRPLPDQRPDDPQRQLGGPQEGPPDPEARRGLADWIIRTFTDPGGHVLDHCFGSGSAGVVAVRLGRRFTGGRTRSRVLRGRQGQGRGRVLSPIGIHIVGAGSRRLITSPVARLLHGRTHTGFEIVPSGEDGSAETSADHTVARNPTLRPSRPIDCRRPPSRAPPRGRPCGGPFARRSSTNPLPGAVVSPSLEAVPDGALGEKVVREKVVREYVLLTAVGPRLTRGEFAFLLD